MTDENKQSKTTIVRPHDAAVGGGPVQSPQNMMERSPARPERAPLTRKSDDEDADPND